MKPFRLWIGLMLLAFGVLGILDATGALESTELVADWWPIAIVGAGLAAMIAQRRVSLGPVFISGIGLVLLADQQAWTTEDLAGPAILVAIGFAILFGAFGRGPRGAEGESPIAVFGASKVKEHSQHFTHADATALFGGATLDLREAKIDDEATVDATAIFGGVDVLVPKGWRVNVGGLPIFGGYEDKTEANGSVADDAPKLDIRATAIFGGVDVANEPK
jgi:hypothetical protein